jgi:hypothetical protein
LTILVSFVAPQGVGEEFSEAADQGSQHVADDTPPLHESPNGGESSSPADDYSDEIEAAAARPVARTERMQGGAVSPNITAPSNFSPNHDYANGLSPARQTTESLLNPHKDTSSELGKDGAILQVTDQTPFARQPPLDAYPTDLQPEQGTQLTEREAFLFMTYIQKLAPSVSSHYEIRSTLLISNVVFSLMRVTRLDISPWKSPVSLSKIP